MLTPSDILVFDLETTIRAPAPHFGATPSWRGNRVVLAGFKADQRDITVTDNLQELVNQIGPNTLIVGHNLGFDLHYLLREFDIPKGVSLWDTQKFDYLLCGRGARQPSLEKTALRMEVDFTKDSEVSERFKVGIGSDKIDRDLLTKYLVADVQTTYDIYVKQRATVTNDAKLAYLQELMNGIAVTTEMSRNGMPFSRLGAAAEARELQAKHDGMYATAEARWTREWPDELPPRKSQRYCGAGSKPSTFRKTCWMTRVSRYDSRRERGPGKSKPRRSRGQSRSSAWHRLHWSRYSITKTGKKHRQFKHLKGLLTPARIAKRRNWREI